MSLDNPIHGLKKLKKNHPKTRNQPKTKNILKLRLVFLKQFQCKTKLLS